MIAMYLNVTALNMCCETTYWLFDCNDCNDFTSLYIQVDIVVSQHNRKHLAALKAKYEVLVSQLVNDYALAIMMFITATHQYPIGPRWCYIHRDGVDRCENGLLLKFRPYEGRLPLSPGQISSNSVLREAYITVNAIL